MTNAARASVCGFLAGVMDLVEWTPDVSAFAISTQVQHHFPGLHDFLQECPVPTVESHAGEVDVDRFLFHLEHLKVSDTVYQSF